MADQLRGGTTIGGYLAWTQAVNVETLNTDNDVLTITYDYNKLGSYVKYIGRDNTTVMNNANYGRGYVTSVSNGTTIGLPSSAWYHIMYFRHFDNNGYGGQIAIPLNHDGKMCWRHANGTTWGAWKQIWALGDSVSSAVWNDLAEYMESVKDDYSPGDVVAVDDNGKLYKTNQYNQSNVVGVYSDTFGFSLGGEYLENEEKLPIGISGRVNVKVINKEEIKVGDLLISSEIPGYAAKASSNKAEHIGCIIGKVTSLNPIVIIENNEQKNTITNDMVTMIIMLA